VFTLHRFEGLSHEEIARQLNISRVSSQTYMARALVQLRAFLADRNHPLMLLAWFLLQR
jgi:RNA polymerase sigma-70 factor (ECF subfamily)